MIRVRKAEPADLDNLTDLARDYTNESGLPLTFNRDHARRTFWGLLHAPGMDLLVVDIGETVLGGFSVTAYDSDYYDEVFAYIDKFYVSVELRGTGVARALAKAIVLCLDRRGARLALTSSAADMGARNDMLYENLFKRYGFAPLGRMIMRS